MTVSHFTQIFIDRDIGFQSAERGIGGQRKIGGNAWQKDNRKGPNPNQCHKSRSRMAGQRRYNHDQQHPDRKIQRVAAD